MTDKKSNDSRRKLLKSIAAGSGAVVAGKSLPESWTKPVIDSIVLPAHAETTQTCCAGVFCDLAFGKEFIIGSAEVRANCIINMEGNSIDGGWSGDGTVAADGSFSFQVSFESDEDITGAVATGTVTQDCSRIQGKITITAGEESGFVDFSGSVSDGATSIDDCIPDASDIRLKTNIEALPISREGYNLYKFQYVDENNENTYVGVMAQDVISRNPEAVIKNESGFYMVRYAQLGLKMVTFDEWESEGPDSVELKH